MNSEQKIGLTVFDTPAVLPVMVSDLRRLAEIPCVGQLIEAAVCFTGHCG